MSYVPAVLALLCLYVAGDLWLHRHGARHPRFVGFWWLASRFLLGAGLIALGAIYLRWDSVVFFIVGAWYLGLGVVVLAWLVRKRPESSGSRTSS